MARGRPRKYAPLGECLAALTVDEVRLTFPEIEAIIGAPLPDWAHYPAFWTNSSRGMFRLQPWVQAGWRVARTELHRAEPAVTFVRVTVPPRSPAR
jgi:hypothetical protein